MADDRPHIDLPAGNQVDSGRKLLVKALRPVDVQLLADDGVEGQRNVSGDADLDDGAAGADCGDCAVDGRSGCRTFEYEIEIAFSRLKFGKMKLYPAPR